MVVTFDIETLGLDAFTHQIVLIGMKIENKIIQWKLWEEENELNIILKCLEKLKIIPLYEIDDLKTSEKLLMGLLNEFPSMLEV